jgi:hypothetical protein
LGLSTGNLVGGLTLDGLNLRGRRFRVSGAFKLTDKLSQPGG